MTPEDAFTDLRLNRQDGENNESFWPSFTDIMTVIVMIFLIAMVVLLLRNIELVNQLRATMEAERSAQELARTTGEEKETLALRLIQAENEISMQNIRIMQLEEERKSRLGTMSEQSSTILSLETERDNLRLRQKQLVAENFTLSSNLKSTQTALNTTRQGLDTSQQNLASTQQQLTSSQEQLARTQAEFTSLQAEFDSNQQELVNLQERFELQSLDLQQARSAEQLNLNQLSQVSGELEELQIKYQRLVRPARSPEGRYLVEVRYRKQRGQNIIQLKTPETNGFVQTTLSELDQKLTAIKNKQGKSGLYVKVIIPENSGLNFNEAWGFTNRIHRQYDYYFQQESAPALVPEPVETN